MMTALELKVIGVTSGVGIGPTTCADSVKVTNDARDVGLDGAFAVVGWLCILIATFVVEENRSPLRLKVWGVGELTIPVGVCVEGEDDTSIAEAGRGMNTVAVVGLLNAAFDVSCNVVGVGIGVAATVVGEVLGLIVVTCRAAAD